MPDWFNILTLYYVSEWVIRLLLIPIAVRRHPSTVALGWLALIFFVPWIGLLLYVAITTEPLVRRRRARHREIVRRVEEDGHLGRLDEYVVPRRAFEEHRRDMVRLFERLGHTQVLTGNAVDVTVDCDGAVQWMEEAIDRAQHHVHLLFYVFDIDATGARIADALKRATGRGVVCRVLADALGSGGMLKEIAPELRRAGVQVQTMLPVNLFRRGLHRIDVRNHRKLLIVDGVEAQTGSQNVCDASYGHRDLAWHDIWLRLRGPVVHQLQTVFVEDWLFETDEMLLDSGDDRLYPPLPPLDHCPGDIAVQTLPSGPGYPTRAMRDMLVDAIYEADRSVIITTPYFVPDEPLALALRSKAHSGVRVDIVVPRRSDHALVSAAGAGFFDELLRAGARIHRHREGILHAKTLTIDDEFAIVGSANFDIRSFTLNFELNLALFGQEITRRITQLQLAYIDESHSISLEAWRARPRWQRWMEDATKIAAPLL